MLQIKCWSWNINQPASTGKTADQIEKEINKFLKKHKCKADDFEIFLLDNGIMFARVFYTIRKKK